jgi:hypothetical protein
MHPLDAYLHELREIRASGSGVTEVSYYPPRESSTNWADAKPKVRCILNLRNTSARLDGGLFLRTSSRGLPDEWTKG